MTPLLTVMGKHSHHFVLHAPLPQAASFDLHSKHVPPLTESQSRERRELSRDEEGVRQHHEWNQEGHERYE